MIHNILCMEQDYYMKPYHEDMALTIASLRHSIEKVVLEILIHIPKGDKKMIETKTEEEILLSVRNLARRIARHYIARLPASVSFDDIEQVAWLEGWRAFHRYDPQGGAILETFLTHRMRGAILDELRAESPHTRSTTKGARKISAAVVRVEQRELRSALPEEVAMELGLSVDDYFRLLADSDLAHTFSLDTPSVDGEEREPSLFEVHPAYQLQLSIPSIEEERIKKEKDQILEKALGNLSEKDRTLLLRYYDEELRFPQIAELMGVTESRVCQLHEVAIRKLSAEVEILQYPHFA